MTEHPPGLGEEIMASTESLPRNRRHFVEWLLLLGSLLALGAYLANSERLEYLRTQGHERERLASQAAVIEKNLVPQLYSVNRALEGILEQLPAWQRAADGFSLASRRLQLTCDTLAGIRTMVIMDAQGRVFSSNKTELIGRDLSQQDGFQKALKNPKPKTLYVTPPLRTVLDTYAIGLIRIITGSSGEFAGIVIAFVDPAYFKTLLDSVRYTPDASSDLVHGDGKIFMMAPESSDLAGRDLARPDSLFTRHRNSGALTSVFSGVTSLTGEERMSAFQTIQPADLAMDKALVVTVSRALSAIFAPWYRELKVVGASFGFFCLAASLSLLFYQRHRRLLSRIADSRERMHKLVEQALREKNAELEHARSVAEKANLAKSEFLSSMSHELRTPLNAILGFAQLIDSGSSPPTPIQKRNLDQILKAGWHLLELVNEILDLSQIESGKAKLSPESVSLGDVMLECRAMMEPEAQNRGIVMTFPRFDAACFVKADRTRVKQVLINLLSNAIKYNKPGGADSNVGVGSVFWIELSLTTAPLSNALTSP